MAESKNFYLICYDIRSPKRWRKAFQLLKGYGENFQYSIFRCQLTQRDREKLRWELEEILEPEDSLLIAGLCGRFEPHRDLKVRGFRLETRYLFSSDLVCTR